MLVNCQVVALALLLAAPEEIIICCIHAKLHAFQTRCVSAERGNLKDL